MWYKVFMCIAIPVVAIAWLAYWLHEKKLDREEAAMPKSQRSSERLKKTRSEVSDWAQQMANFKRPTRPTPDDADDDEDAPA